MISRIPNLTIYCVLLFATAGLRAQEPAEKPLTTIEHVLAYDIGQVATHPRQVRVKGVVVGVSSLFNFFHMHDGRRGIAVRYPRRLTPPKQGDQIEVIGETSVNSHEGLQIMRILAQDFTISGTAELPQAEPSEREHLLAPSAMDQWLSCEARISEWRFTAPDLLLRLVLRDGVFDAFVTLPTASAPPAELFGARVRLTGIVTFTPALGRVLFVPDMKQFQVLEQGANQVFDTPLVTTLQIRQQQVEVGRCVRVRGIVLGQTSEDVLHLRDGDAALRIQMPLPWNRVAKSRTATSIGDEIEVVGFQIEAHDGSLTTGCDLCECQFRITGKVAEPQPVTAALPDIAEGAHTADLVETRGRLLTLQQVPLERGEWRTTMLIESGDTRLPAALHTQGRPALDTIKTDDDVLVRGLVEPGNAVDPRQLRLLGADAVKSLGLSPAVRTRQFWLWAGPILGVVIIFSGWIAALRKSNRVKTEVAALLEKNVTQRTAELSKAQAELTRALDQERELGELKSRFVTMVSHEFRTPLGIIMSAIELMRHYDERLPQDQRLELQQDIFNATRLMASLMEQVLVLGRVEAGKVGCKTAPCDLDILACKITDESLSATNRKCPITWHPEEDLRGAMADESLLRHIFSNLIANAVKYSPEGSEVTFTARRDGNDAVFQIIDHGIGIPSADRARLFEAFHRCSNVGEIPGTGLGLVIVKRCVELHGGSLEIGSVVGEGSTFTVRLPLFGA
jgi:signal transduction histidine kinase